MEYNYLLNPAISILFQQIERGSKEKEVQAVWESLLWTVFPASDHWMTLTKYKQGATEPDNVVKKIVHFNAGWAPIDTLMVELKRPKEKLTMGVFEDIARNLLDDHLAESNNPPGSILFGAVGIGGHVVFYSKTLPDGCLQTNQTQPFDLMTDATSVQEYFEYHKSHVPQWPAPDVASNPASTYQAQASTSGYQAEGSSSTYQALESGIQARGSNEAFNSGNPAPLSTYQDGDDEHTEGALETQQADNYITVKVRRERHQVRPDEFTFRTQAERCE